MSFSFVNKKSVLDEKLSAGEHLSVVQFTNASIRQDDHNYCDLASKFTNVVFYKFEIDREPLLRKKFKGLPTFVFYHDNRELTRLICSGLDAVETEINDLRSSAFVHRQRKFNTVQSLGSESESKRANDEQQEIDTVQPSARGDEMKRANDDEDEKKQQKKLKMNEELPERIDNLERGPSWSLARSSVSDNLTWSQTEHRQWLSAVSPEVVSKLFGVNIFELLSKEKRKPDELIRLREGDGLESLYEDVYKTLIPLVSCRYPHILMKEDAKSIYVGVVIDRVADYLRRKFKLTEAQLKVGCKPSSFDIVLGHLVKEVRPDILVKGTRNGEECYFFPIIACKTGVCELGVQQLIVYMRECIYKNNKQQGPIYGFCSTATHFNLVKYHPKSPDSPKASIDDFQIFETCRFLFVEMKNRKEDWMQNCTLFIQILYSILVEKLGLSE